MIKTENIYISSKAPIVYYFWIILSIAILAELLISNVNVLYSIIIFLILAVILYVIIAQHACSFTLTDTLLKFNYMFPVNGSKEIDLSEVKHIEFKLSYFNFLEEDFKMSVFYWFHPYETVTFYFTKKEPISVNFNSALIPSKRMYRYLKEKFRLID